MSLVSKAAGILWKEQTASIILRFTRLKRY